jgi:DNA-binding XRE family transcriptional regulator
VKEESNANSKYYNVLEKIIATRIECRITQLNSAYFLNLGESGCFKIEKGKTTLDLKRLLSILELLKISQVTFLKS